MLIYKKSFNKGWVNVDFTYTKKKPTSQIILFYGANPSGPVELSCGGDKENVAL